MAWKQFDKTARKVTGLSRVRDTKEKFYIHVTKILHIKFDKDTWIKYEIKYRFNLEIYFQYNKLNALI